jgi:prolyl 4-hydroxylase
MLIEAGFLLQAELVELVNLIRKFSRPAPQQNWGLDECGSSTAALSNINSVAVVRVERRLNDLLGWASKYGEGLRGVKYEPGQGYRMHHDAFSPGNEKWDEFAGARGNRTWTAMIYLNTLTGGGATVFPELGVRIEPRGGMLVAWSNLKSDGSIDMDLLHAAEPHRAAEKFIVTQWFRELPNESGQGSA